MRYLAKIADGCFFVANFAMPTIGLVRVSLATVCHFSKLGIGLLSICVCMGIFQDFLWENAQVDEDEDGCHRRVGTQFLDQGQFHLY